MIKKEVRTSVCLCLQGAIISSSWKIWDKQECNSSKKKKHTPDRSTALTGFTAWGGQCRLIWFLFQVLLKSSCVISELSHHYGTGCSLLSQHEAKFPTLHQSTHGYTWQVVCKKVRLLEMKERLWRLATLFSKTCSINRKWQFFFDGYLDGIDSFLIFSVFQHIRYRLFCFSNN